MAASPHMALPDNERLRSCGNCAREVEVRNRMRFSPNRSVCTSRNSKASHRSTHSIPRLRNETRLPQTACRQMPRSCACAASPATTVLNGSMGTAGDAILQGRAWALRRCKMSFEEGPSEVGPDEPWGGDDAMRLAYCFRLADMKHATKDKKKRSQAGSTYGSKIPIGIFEKECYTDNKRSKALPDDPRRPTQGSQRRQRGKKWKEAGDVRGAS
jgi:hypothetical protein